MANGQRIIFVIAILLFFYSGGESKASLYQGRPPVVRSALKAYTLIHSRGVVKTEQQMLGESQAGKEHFKDLFARGIPQRLDLMKYMTRIKDQGYRGTCVAFAINAMIEAQIKKVTGRTIDLSEQYLFWESKLMESILPNSDGSHILDVLQTMDINAPHSDGGLFRGVPLESAWRYEPYGWFDDKKNHPDCYHAYHKDNDHVPSLCWTNGDPPMKAVKALKFMVTNAQDVPSSPESIMGYINVGIPVIVGVDFYDRAWGFNNSRTVKYRTGSVAMPAPGETNNGAHAILLVGYDAESRVYLFKNSWGNDDWGAESPLPGYGVIPFDYVRKFAIATVAKAVIPP